MVIDNGEYKEFNEGGKKRRWIKIKNEGRVNENIENEVWKKK